MTTYEYSNVIENVKLFMQMMLRRGFYDIMFYHREASFALWKEISTQSTKDRRKTQ